MKFTIERSALLRALAHAQSVVERRNTIPILANAKFDAGSNQLRLSATDMDLGVVETVAAQVQTAGAGTAPAHMLYDIVRKMPEGAQVEFERTPAGQVKLRAGRSVFTLAMLPVEEFPAIPDTDLAYRFTVAAPELRALIDRARFAISTEETRYYLNGIYLHATEVNDVAVLRAVATDGHRLARVEIPLPEGAAGMPGVIVPRKTVNEVRKLIDETSGDVAVSLSENKIRFAFEGVVLTSKLIDGTFPDYERVIPTSNDRRMEIGRKEFAEAVDRVSTIATEKSRAVKLAVGAGTLSLSASSLDAGSAVEELEVAYDAEPLEIGFNSRYLLDMMQQIEGDVAEFLMADATAPTIVRDKSDLSVLYVLMPMRV